MRTMPIIMPIFTSSSSGHAGPLPLIALIIIVVLAYVAAYMVIGLVTDKLEYKKFSLFGKVVFFPIGLTGWLVKRLF